MVDDLAAEIEDRILLLPPTRRDADAAAVVFRKAGLALTLCGDVADLCAEIERGAAVALLPAEAVLTDREGRLARVLGEQPPWSDFPLITLMHPTQSAASIRELEQLGPMTLVRRPIEIRSLVSTVRAALRDRRRQYDRRADFIERERQAQALRENDRHKDEFLAMLAHELRNPLAAVNNAVAVLKRSGDPASQAWASGIVERQMRQLVRLIDDLLDVARINGGKIRLQTTLVDAGPILDQAIESVRPQVDERRQTLTVAIERGRLPLNVDAPRVAQIVLNLLSNASKYGEPGGRIWLTARPEGEAAVISVRDDGMGIPPDKLPEMFRLFAQGDRSLARSEGGLGIGLTIVMRLAEMHGGSVEARSDGPGEGSEFIVRLPLARAAASPCATSAPPPRRRRARRGFWSSTTIWTRPPGWCSSSRSWATRSSPPTMGTRPSRRPTTSGRTSCCWTSACRGWTAIRSPRPCAGTRPTGGPCSSPSRGTARRRTGGGLATRVSTTTWSSRSTSTSSPRSSASPVDASADSELRHHYCPSFFQAARISRVDRAKPT